MPNLRSMRREFAIGTVLWLFCTGPAWAQEDILPAVMALTGETQAEGLDASLVERFAFYRSHPLQVNELSRSRLLSSGLLSRYQVATLLDWREHDGDILSLEELSLVDGFGTARAEALAPFLSFASERAPGSTDQRASLDGEVTLRSAWRSGMANGGGRLFLARPDRWEAGGAVQAEYRADNRVDLTGSSFFLARYGRRYRLILGHFNARFGQGLALWSGFSLSGVASPAAAIRRPSGLSVSRSYAGTGYRGAAVDWEAGRWTFSAFAALQGPAGGNVAWYGRYGQLSATAFRRSDGTARIAADGRFCLRGTDLFAEVANDLPSGETAFVGGVSVPARSGARWALLVRHYPTGYHSRDAGAVRSSTKVADEEGIALAFSNSSLSAGLDAAWHPSKGEGQVKLVSAGTLRTHGPWTWRYRLVERYRCAAPRNRSDLRFDLSWQRGGWLLTGRMEAVRSRKVGLLTYGEAGWKGTRGQVWLRGTAFRIDDWEDRIYAYERNAPGYFSVPSYYGRGCEAAVYAGWKGRRWSAWLQASLLRRKEKPGRTGLKVQLQRNW